MTEYLFDGHLSDEQFRQYRRHGLTYEELLVVDGHLTTCQSCMERYRAMVSAGQREESGARDRSNLSAASDWRKLWAQAYHWDAHLSFEQVSDYVNNMLSAEGNEAVEQHLNACVECQADVDNLRALQAESSQDSAGPSWLRSLWRRVTSSFPERHLPGGEGDNETVNDNRTAGRRPWGGNKIRVSLATAAVALAALAGFIFLSPQPKVPAEERLIKALHLDKDPQSLLLQATRDLKTFAGIFSGIKGSEASPNVDLIYPVNTYVLDPKPDLRWQAAPGATIQSVEVFLGSDAWDYTQNPGGSSWQLRRPAKPDRRYTWRVTAEKEGVESSAEAMFYLPPTDVLALLNQDIRSLTPLQRGALYLKAGLLKEAETEFQTALSQEQSSQRRASVQGILSAIHRQIEKR